MVSGHPFCEHHGELSPHPAKSGTGASEIFELENTSRSRSSDGRRSIRGFGFQFVEVGGRSENEHFTQFNFLFRRLTSCVPLGLGAGLFEIPRVFTGKQRG